LGIYIKAVAAYTTRLEEEIKRRLAFQLSALLGNLHKSGISPYKQHRKKGMTGDFFCQLSALLGILQKSGTTPYQKRYTYTTFKEKELHPLLCQRKTSPPDVVHVFSEHHLIPQAFGDTTLNLHISML
jgi:hypothetical protein